MLTTIRKKSLSVVWVILLVAILLVAAAFRFTGINWDESQHLHPDERFLTMVASSISSTDPGDYFDTNKSTLNPHNVGYGFYVYGTLPLFLVRWVAEMVHQTGYDEIFLVGRVFSGAADLFTVLLVYLTALRLFRRQPLALMAAAFMALAVLPIQLSHYFTVDNFANLFTMLAIYYAVCVFTAPLPLDVPETEESEGQGLQWRSLATDWQPLGHYLLFGLGLGLAMASKVSIIPLAALLPLAAVVYYWRLPVQQRDRLLLVILRNLVLAALVSVIVFRIFQPYAFTGPGFFGVGLNQKWFDNLSSLQAQSTGDVDAPPGLQWARRPITFAWTNMVEWGLGLPLGLLAWAGFLWMGWRILRGNWKPYLLIWLWNGAYFTWQAVSWVRAMRYQIFVYPTLAIIAAWAVFALWDHRARQNSEVPPRTAVAWPKILSVLTAVIVLGSTLAWAYAFTRIYNRPMTRVEATRWIYQNVPAPINLHIQTQSGMVNQPMAYVSGGSLAPDEPYYFTFLAPASGWISELTLNDLSMNLSGPTEAVLMVELTHPGSGNAILASGSLSVGVENKDKSYTIAFETLVAVQQNQVYGVSVHFLAGRGSAYLSGDILIPVYTRANQVVSTLNKVTLAGVSSHSLSITSTLGGSLRWLSLPVKTSGLPQSESGMISVTILESGIGGKVVGSVSQMVKGSPETQILTLHFSPAVTLKPAAEYLVVIDNTSQGQVLVLDGTLSLRTGDDSVRKLVTYPVHLIRPANPYLATADIKVSGLLSEVQFGRVAQQDASLNGEVDLTVEVTTVLRPDAVLSRATARFVADPAADERGSSLTVKLEQPLPVNKGDSYFIRVRVSEGAVGLRGSAPANESTWDDGLPLRMDGYDGYGGMYQNDLNFEMYWDDSQDKAQRFQRVLDSADYIFITSNRQWGTTTRVQERYPLTTAYYRALLGCPAEEEITWCYSVAEPGMFTSQIGFELVKVFQSDPNLGSQRFNTQFAEEAFTVYDHPKVLIFQKAEGYSSAAVTEMLSSVDLSKVVHVTPRKAGVPANLMLPDYRLAQQQAGGTWSELFDRNLIFNRYPFLALVLWYLAASLLGWMCYPMVRMALGGLADKGFPLVRLVGMLVLAYLAWLAGSSGLTFTRPVIWLSAAVLLGLNTLLFILQRDAIKEEWSHKKRYFLVVEGVTLAFFVLFLLIRLGNPDLWHPAKGGEKPMDFSYFNAVLKSTSFPPYDPWFAGGYINYYYYGFVVAGVLVKALGIVPSVAYNLLLPSFFSMVAMGAFSVGWNLLSGGRSRSADDLSSPPEALPRAPWLAGLASSIGLLILGNLGTVKMVWEGFQKLVVAEDVMSKGDIFSRTGWMIQGLVKFIGGNPLPYNTGEWYWNPSRAIPGDPITEFPFFSFLYGDPHAHLWALPVTILALAWALSVLRTRWDWQQGQSTARAVLRFTLSLLLGGMVIGALRPMNTWDLPTYLVLGMLALLASAQPWQRNWWKGALAAGLLAALAMLLYQPFADWYGQGYNAVRLYEGDLTPEWAYTTHWGVFLFLIASWMAWESIDWMAKTPVSALNRIKRHFGFYMAAVLGMVVVIIVLLVMKIQPAWIIVLMGVWAVVLMLRKDQPVEKRAVLFMTGTALALTLAVELVVLVGDIGRMNTVFKFYLQAWTLFSLSAAAATIWLWPAVLTAWHPRVRAIWQVVMVLLVAGAALYPLTASVAKIQDRMSPDVPFTLDGMAYMATSTYSEEGANMDLSQDERAIRWMQEHVQGSPVIVEANVPEYRWGTRYTIYTGLPGVVGWNWHQRQQRAVTPSQWVTNRVEEIEQFYRTTNLSVSRQFLKRYNVRYIILGQLERAYYSGPGLIKFEDLNGKLWKEIYRDGSTVIYEVLE